MQSLTRVFPSDAHHAFDAIRPGHFWFESRRRALTDVLRSITVPADVRVLEVGCGDGYLLPQLPGRFRVGVDLNVRDLSRAGDRGVQALVVASGDRLPFQREFMLVGAFDVVEHVANDVALLRACASVLVPRGWLVLTTPAGPELWSHLDRYAGHYRRYTRTRLQALFDEAGLTIVRLFPLFRLLWPLAWVNARLRRGHHVTDPVADYSVGRAANALLRLALGLEWYFWRQSPRGTGTSWCVVARRADDG